MTFPDLEFRKEDSESNLPARFEKVVAAFPDCVAIQGQKTTLTYDQLNRIANRLARAICAQPDNGQGPVAFLIGEPIYQIAAMLGILKAGRMYLPLERTFPAARLAFMCQDAQVGIIIADGQFLDLAKEAGGEKAHVVNLERPEPGLSEGNLGIDISPDSPVYVLYTSGSSGQPKGVLQNHRNLVHSIWGASRNYQITPEDRFGLLTSTSFAASNGPVYGALLNGATVYPFEAHSDFRRLAEWLKREAITVLLMVPTMFRHFALSLKGGEDLSRLRLIVLMGEPLLQSHIELYQRLFPQTCKLRNSYAATEMHTACTFLIDHDTQLYENSVPIGFPVADKQVFLLDEGGFPVGEGEVGEITIRSRYLSPGYWRHPELTREKFNPDLENPDIRLFRTGDLGRLRADGCLVHAGRKDFQVKVRGFRVELGEIESLLLRYPGVHGAAVALIESEHREGRLMAFLVPRGDRDSLNWQQIRAYLSERLPEYMLPSALTILDALPLTPTGKVDRLALPALVPAARLGDDHHPSRDEHECQLVKIWENVLGVGPLGIQDNFFELGGNSLLAARLIAQIEEEFGKRVEIGTLLEAPTVEQLGRVVRNGSMKPRAGSLVALQSRGTRPGFYLVHGVGGQLLRFRKLASYLEPDYPLYGLQSRGLDGQSAPNNRIEQMADHYIQEIQAQDSVGPYYLGGFSYGGFVAFEMARQLLAMDKEVALLVIFDAKASRAPQFSRSLSKTQYLQFQSQSLAMRSRYKAHLSMGDLLRQIHTFQGGNTLKRKAQSQLPLADKRLEALYEGTMEPELIAMLTQADLSSRYHQIMEANLQALEDYVLCPYAGKVTLFQSIQASQGEHYGWDLLARGGVEIHRIPGTHLSMLEEPNVAGLAKVLKACIDSADRGLG